VLLSGLGHSPRRRRWLVKSGVAQTIPPSQWLQSLDRALEMAEDSVLAEGSAAAARELAVEELDVVDAFSQADVDHLKGVLRRRVYDPDSIIFRKEQACDGLYLLVSGFIEVRLPPTEHHAPVRLATFGPGTILGELALLDGGTRSADAVADGPAVAYHLPLDAFHALRSTNPVAATQLLMNVGRQLVDRLRLTNARLQAME